MIFFLSKYYKLWLEVKFNEHCATKLLKVRQKSYKFSHFIAPYLSLRLKVLIYKSILLPSLRHSTAILPLRKGYKNLRMKF